MKSVILLMCKYYYFNKKNFYMKNLKMMLMASLLVIGENIIALDASYFAQAGKCMFQKELSLVSKSLGAVNGGSLGLVSGATVGIARGAFMAIN